MMRNKIWTALAAITVGVVLMPGCSDDFLKEKKVYDSLGDQVFETEITTQQVLDYVYYNTFSGFTRPHLNDAPELGWSDTYAKCTPEYGGWVDYTNPTVTAEALDASKCPKMYGTSITASIGDNFYTRIRTCNLVIAEVKKSILPDDAKARLLGQAYFLRARQYFQIVRTHGGVPYVKTPQYPKDPEIRMPRNATSECVTFMLEDLDLAAKNLPGQWPDPTTQWGMPTRGTALAYKSRILLWWASPVVNPNYSTDQSRWQAALDAGLAAEKQLVADGFGLYGEDAPGVNGAAWANMFKAYDQVNKEGIWMKILSSLKDAGSNGWESAVRLTSQGGGDGTNAPAEMVDLFPMADGSRPTEANGYNKDFFFENRDPRFYRTFAFPGSFWDLKSPKATESKDIWTYGWYDTPANEYYVVDGAMTQERKAPNRRADNISGQSAVKVRKMSVDNKISSAEYSLSGVDIMEYRFAELLLNIAESYAGVDNFTKCSEYLARVRKRAGIPQGANNYGLGTINSKAQAFEACLYERSVELAYEGKRFYDLNRWMLFEGGPADRQNTCTYLGVEPINNTRRTELYLLVRDNATGTMYYGSDDPFTTTPGLATDVKLADRPASLDPDDSRFSERMQKLKEFYSKYIFQQRGVRWDQANGEPATIMWKEKCYIFGLNKSTLDFNGPYILQNVGWPDFNDAPGTFDPLK